MFRGPYAMKLMLLLLSAAVLHGCFGQMNTQHLLRSLLDSYEFTSLRPVLNASDVIHVEFMLLLANVIELNEKHQTFEIGTWIAQQWTDEFMRWDPEKHNGVKRLFVPKSKIWMPDITLYNSIDRNFESYKDTLVVVNYNGLMRWEAPAILKTFCKIDARLFPFDTQVCKLKFSSWVYNGLELKLHLLDEMDSKNVYEDVGVWELRDVKENRSESFYNDIPFQELTYSIYLRRRPLFHIIQIIFPCVLLSLLNLMVFVLPPESGEKISLGMANLLSLVLFQQLISNSVPPTSDKAPIIGYFFCPMIVLSSTSIVCTVIVLNLFHRDNRQSIPRWIKTVVLKHIAKVVRYKPLKRSSPATRRCGHSLLNSKQDLAEKSRESIDKEQEVNVKFTPHYSQVGAKEVHGTDETPDSPHKTDVALNWQDVALVVDQAALFLSSFVTFLSVVVSVSLYILMQ